MRPFLSCFFGGKKQNISLLSHKETPVVTDTATKLKWQIVGSKLSDQKQKLLLSFLKKIKLILTNYNYHNVPNLLLGYVVVLIPHQLCCRLWFADTPIADYHGPIAGQHTTWRGKSTTTWSPATQRDPCVLLLLSSGLTSTHTARNIQRLLSIDFGW